MEFAPTIDEVQNAIEGSWKRAGVHAAPPPRVVQTLVFFTPSEDREPYAVVNAHGGNSFHVGDWRVTTVSCKAPQASALLDCRIGETAQMGADPLLLLARNGGELPPLDSCRKAASFQERVRKHSRLLVSEIDETAHLLSKHRSRLEVELGNFARFGELSRACEILSAELAGIRAFEANLVELRELPARRRLVDVVAEIEREAADLQAFRDDVQSAIVRQAETLADHRARYDELERARLRDEQYLRQERERVEALYHAALRSPEPIRHDEVLAELGDIAKVADIDGADTFLLRRRLYILRLRCRHSIAPPIGEAALRTLMPEIEEEIHRLKRR